MRFDWKAYCGIGLALVGIGLWFLTPVVSPHIAAILIVVGVAIAVGAPVVQVAVSHRQAAMTVRLVFENVERRPYWCQEPHFQNNTHFMQFVYRVGVVNESHESVPVQVVVERI